MIYKYLEPSSLFITVYSVLLLRYDSYHDNHETMEKSFGETDLER